MFLPKLYVSREIEALVRNLQQYTFTESTVGYFVHFTTEEVVTSELLRHFWDNSARICINSVNVFFAVLTFHAFKLNILLC